MKYLKALSVGIQQHLLLQQDRLKIKRLFILYKEALIQNGIYILALQGQWMDQLKLFA